MSHFTSASAPFRPPDIWLLETARGVLSRFTFDADVDNCPIWSPDGSRLVFESHRKGVPGLSQKLASGADACWSPSEHPVPTDWSRDRRFILYRKLDPKTDYDLWVLPVLPQAGDRKSFAFVNTSLSRRGSFASAACACIMRLAATCFR